MRSRILLATLAAAGLAACAASEPAAFRPAERVTAQGNAGEPATSYEIRDQTGKLGEVQIWSDGAAQATVQGQPGTVMYAGVRVKNLSTVPLSLDPRELRLEGIQAGNQSLGDAQLLSTQPQDLVIPPQSVRELQLAFALPIRTEPSQISAFNLRWSVDANGRRFLQFTPFVQDRGRERAAYPVAYVPAWGFYYDPFLYDPFYSPVYVIHQVPARRVVIVPSHRFFR